MKQGKKEGSKLTEGVGSPEIVVGDSSELRSAATGPILAGICLGGDGED